MTSESLTLIEKTGRAGFLWKPEDWKARTDGKGNYICLNCGKSLDFDRRRVKFCSNSCRDKHYIVHPILTWESFREQVFERDNFTCRKCGYKGLSGHYDILQCDHITPLFLGGTHFDLANAQTLCIKCHVTKSRDEAKQRTKKQALILNGIQTILPQKRRLNKNE